MLPLEHSAILLTFIIQEIVGPEKQFSVFLRVREVSGSVVECLTGDRGAMGLSLTGVMRCGP